MRMGEMCGNSVGKGTLFRLNFKKLDSLGNYLTLLAKQLFKEGKPETAVRQFARYGTPFLTCNFEFYGLLAKSLIQNSPSNESLQSLKEMLFKLVSGYNMFI